MKASYLANYKNVCHYKKKSFRTQIWVENDAKNAKTASNVSHMAGMVLKPLYGSQKVVFYNFACLEPFLVIF